MFVKNIRRAKVIPTVSLTAGINDVAKGYSFIGANGILQEGALAPVTAGIVNDTINLSVGNSYQIRSSGYYEKDVKVVALPKQSKK